MEGRIGTHALSPPSAPLSSRKFERFLSVGNRLVEESLQVEYPSCTCKGEQPSKGLLPIDVKLLKEFWTLKEAKLPNASAVPQEGLCSVTQEACYWGPVQLRPSRLSRSVSAHEFGNAVERCVRAGKSIKSNGRVRLGRQSAAAGLSAAAPPPPPRGTVGCILAPAVPDFPQDSATTTAAPTGGTVATTTASDIEAGHLFRSLHEGLSAFALLHSSEGCCEGGCYECKQHGGGRHEAMDRRVRGGRLLRSQSKDQHSVSALSLLDGPMLSMAAPPTPSPRSRHSEQQQHEEDVVSISAATTTAGTFLAGPDLHRRDTARGELSGGDGGSGSIFGHPLGFSLGRLYSLDSATLHQLDRALSSACFEHHLAGGGAVGGSGSPVLGPATASAPTAPSALGGTGRIYKVRPLGAAASSLSSMPSASYGQLAASPFSRCNSTLLDYAEEQASLAAAVSLSGHHNHHSQADYLALLSANNSMVGASYHSSAAGSLSASPNPHQPHISLATLLGAATAGGDGGRRMSAGGTAAGAAATAAAAAAGAGGCSLPLHPSSAFLQSYRPADLGRDDRGAILAAPDMRLFAFSSPEDFYMAAKVLLDARLPGGEGSSGGEMAEGESAGGSPAENGIRPCV